MTLDGRVALVTGASRGIGREIALRLAQAGADVAVNYRREAEAADDVVDKIRAMGRRAIAVRADVADPAAVEAMAERVSAELGTVGILVNNAGISSTGRTIVDTEPDEVARLFAVHTFAPHQLCRLLVPGMRELDRGDVIFVSSSASRNRRPNSGPYSMAKTATETLAVTLAKEERKHHIRVNVVAPGLTETEMGRRLAKAAFGVDNMRDLDAKLPFGRVTQPSDVADAVCFLVTTGYVSGEVLYLDGSPA